MNAKVLQIIGGDVDYPTDEWGSVDERLDTIISGIKEKGGWVDSITFFPKLFCKPDVWRIRIKGYYYKDTTVKEIIANQKALEEL